MGAFAATVTLDLAGDPAAATTASGTDATGSYTYASLALVDPVTQAAPAGALDVMVGDSLTGTINFSSAVTLPATDANASLLLALGYGDVAVDYTESLSFFLNGAPVAIPASFSPYGGSTGFLAGGFIGLGGPSPDFSFDQLRYTLDITNLADGTTLAPLSSFQFAALEPGLQLYSHVAATTAPVPEPATWMLVLSGMAVALMSVRRRQPAVARAMLQQPFRR